MSPKFFLDKRPHNGLSYEDYRQKTIEFVESTNPEGLEDSERSLYDYTKLNLHRSKRIDRVYKVNEEFRAILQGITTPQIWMVLTEDWCGDSAQNLPYIVKMAEENPLITLRIMERDKNLDIMDLYLTGGKSRSIPKLVAFDEDGNELFQWGPRPKEAQDNVNQWKESGLSKTEFMEKLHLWYAGNRGKALEQEFMWILCEVDECKEA
ncbi:MAG: thioredoxin family protein [Bacteroidetes bacterium]|nr:thioredoxin family protein [Bacteroidota bacterium]